MAQDFYEILGVDRNADKATLKSAYRKLAMKYHPDRNPGDEEAEKQFKRIGEAYDVLKDDQKRAAYDRFGHAAFQDGAGAGGGPGGFDFAGFSDIFDEFFGEFTGRARGRGGAGGARRGADLRYDMAVTLEEAFSGKEVDIAIPTHAECGDCGGNGAKPGTEPKTCTQCGGAGKVRSQQGFFVVERPCPLCRGAGRMVSDPCETCRGTGRVERTKTLSVSVPPGVDDGTRIRLAGEGEAGARGGPPGDLYIFVSVEPHELFSRDGPHLFCNVPVTMTTAILGGEIEVPTIGGKRAKIKVPDGTQSGKQFRLRGKGMPHLNSGVIGDMMIEVHVETPVNLTKRQKELLREFAEEGGEEVSPRSHSFLDRVRELWEDLTE
ncbi:molecular chaperone DnaJ [Rhodothalassium salexigens DSM 2132]|uniref:Chaperone protein DnaJ n=1 Tax=Rhodothalassium salexigens DSM 2132 TaxID=1188247 RepID=A0A4R2PAR6_RHOSA|nr:molecular chaperone DnaJ [Rhodothalassium salexigens]MBB4212480.1 molecular chaperone DnaJ [Rhodothalassium salexigens DSM 2132]MBK1640101.1 molecular chaperone DnaJ [Rhodothalassium salexigens DSM 2132]TCP31478.1 molecular chaperone DnaJ [Rhodothalassium salexigens DSM 2132]